MTKCEKCGKMEGEVHVCNDHLGQFYICYECASIATIDEVARDVKALRREHEATA